MFELMNLVRSELRQPFAPVWVARDTAAIYLDANESPWDNQLNRYPTQPKVLLQSLAKLYDVDPSQVLLTRGSDEGIDLVTRLFCEASKDSVIICPPTFSMYAFWANIQGARSVEVPLNTEQGFSLNRNKLLEAVTPKTKLIFLCSPNNPTGNLIPIDQIISICEAVSQTAMVVVDEAYIEFANSQSMTAYLSRYKNLIILRTLSKAYGLAGLRCGVVLADAALIALLQAIMPPYPYSVLMMDSALRAMDESNLEQVNAQIAILIEQKKYLAQELKKLPLVIKQWPSCANFLLIQVQDATKVVAKCAKKGVQLRNISSRYLPNAVRISIGKPAENQQLIQILQKVSES